MNDKSYVYNSKNKSFINNKSESKEEMCQQIDRWRKPNVSTTTTKINQREEEDDYSWENRCALYSKKYYGLVAINFGYRI